MQAQTQKSQAQAPGSRRQKKEDLICWVVICSKPDKNSRQKFRPPGGNDGSNSTPNRIPTQGTCLAQKTLHFISRQKSSAIQLSYCESRDEKENRRQQQRGRVWSSQTPPVLIYNKSQGSNIAASMMKSDYKFSSTFAGNHMRIQDSTPQEFKQLVSKFMEDQALLLSR